MSVALNKMPEKPQIKTRICFINNSFVKHIPDLDIIKRCNTSDLPGDCYVLKMENITSKQWRCFQVRKTYDAGSSYTHTTACASVSITDGGRVYFNTSTFNGGKDEVIEFAEVIHYASDLLAFMDDSTDTHNSNSV